MKFRQKPIQVEAMQFTGDNRDEINKFCKWDGIEMKKGHWITKNERGNCSVHTNESFMNAYEPV